MIFSSILAEAWIPPESEYTLKNNPQVSKIRIFFVQDLDKVFQELKISYKKISNNQKLVGPNMYTFGHFLDALRQGGNILSWKIFIRWPNFAQIW